MTSTGSTATNMIRLVTCLCYLTMAAAFSQPSIPLGSLTMTRSLTSTSTSLHAIKLYLDDSNYHQVMATQKAVLVDACATFCGPCKLIEPFLHQAADTFSNDLEVVKLDVEAKHVASVKVELFLQGVLPKALPCLILFSHGKAIASRTGALTQEQLDDFIATNLVQHHNQQLQLQQTKKELREMVKAARQTVPPPKPKARGFISLGDFDDNNDYVPLI